MKNTTVNDFSKDTMLDILGYLTISELYQYQVVCHRLKELITCLLMSHHNRFMTRIKLYSVCVLKTDEETPDNDAELSSSIIGVRDNDPIYLKYSTQSRTSTSNIDAYLDGRLYEHDYCDDCSDISVICPICNKEAFLPIMVMYTAKTKRGKYNEYSSIYTAICSACHNNMLNIIFPRQSNKFQSVYILIGLTCQEFIASL